MIGSKTRIEQNAFRAQHSTTLQLTNLIDRLCLSANNGENTAAIFLDVEKALDRVWNEGLLHKLLQIGTPMNIVTIIKSFIENRTFKVRQEEYLSTSRSALAGVPQGSCLSPFLYAVYTNDMEINQNANLVS